MKSPTPKIILGIDPGYGRVGYGLIEQIGSTMRCREYGCLTTPANSPIPSRLKSIHEQLGAIIARTQPQVVAVEQLFFYNNAKTAIDVGQARGVIILTAQLHGLPIIEVTPLQAKQAVAGFGQADKKQVQRMVALLLKLEKLPTPDDAADALAIAICASGMTPPI